MSRTCSTSGSMRKHRLQTKTTNSTSNRSTSYETPTLRGPALQFAQALWPCGFAVTFYHFGSDGPEADTISLRIRPRDYRKAFSVADLADKSKAG